MANALPIKTGPLFIGIAVILGLITLGLFMSSGKSDNKPQKVVPTRVLTQAVVVPVTPIPQGSAIAQADIKTIQWPQDFLPQGQTFKDVSDVAGRVARQDLLPGEPIYLERVSGPGSNSGMPAVIPQGMRAVTVGVTEVKGVAGFVHPGDRVDVLVTFTHTNGEGEHKSTERITKTVLQNILVLASAQTMGDEDNLDKIETPSGVTAGKASTVTDDSSQSAASSTNSHSRDQGDANVQQQADNDKLQKDLEKEHAQREKERQDSEEKAKLVSSVTLAVTPEQAQVATMAEDVGDLRLVLRPDADINIAHVGTTYGNEILSVDGEHRRAVEPAPPVHMPPIQQPPGYSVEVIQGNNRTTAQF